MRILDFLIQEEEAGCTVEQYLKKQLHFGKRQISRLKFREGGLVLNGLQCRSTERLHTGDFLQIRLDETGKSKANRCPLGKNADVQSNLSVLYEDSDVLAVYKPGGIPVHPSHGHGTDTLWNQIISWQNEKGEEWTPRIIGRLDRDTSGIILLAKTTEAAADLALQREKKILKKTYIAEAEGAFSSEEGWIEKALEKDPTTLNRMRIAEEQAEGLAARTHYRVLRRREDATIKSSILELELEQGRTHQIRVHLASEGHPILGDPIYNPLCAGSSTESERSELHLHAARLCYISPFTKETIEITAPVPRWLKGGIKE